MKKQLKAIYGRSVSSSSNYDNKEEHKYVAHDEKGYVKCEPQKYFKQPKNGDRHQKDYKSRGANEDRKVNFGKWGRETNPKDRFGNLVLSSANQFIIWQNNALINIQNIAVVGYTALIW